MIQTTIESIDVTGREVPPTPELRQCVERAAAALDKRLEPVETLPVQSQWRIVHQPGSEPRVVLNLTTQGVGIKDWLFDVREFRDEVHITQSLLDPISEFARAIRVAARKDLERMLLELQQLPRFHRMGDVDVNNGLPQTLPEPTTPTPAS